MYPLRKYRWHLQRCCTVRTLCCVVAFCILFKISTGYAVNRSPFVQVEDNRAIGVELTHSHALPGPPSVSYEKIAFYNNVVIHFDLKGAPPKVDFLLEVFAMIRRNGATGILLEWEDMFPFYGILEGNRATDAYSMDDIHRILHGAVSFGLDVIPLVQTFGHLEWLLKLQKFRRYRENDVYPQVICLADTDAVNLAKEALRQVIEVHKTYGIKYLHIGADEAFQYGVCQKDVEWFSRHGKGKEDLAAQHFKNIAEFVKSFDPQIKVLAWHDMLRTFPPSTVTATGLSNLIEPVVWDYSETLQQQDEYTWKQLATSFHTVWGSSSFKGANTPSTQEISLVHYMKNNQEWLRHKQMYGPLFKEFRGLILTGWSRYDHFAVLAELLVSGIPSLVLNLQVARAGYGGRNDVIIKSTARALQCRNSISVNNPKTLVNCAFPGSAVFSVIHVDIPMLSARFDEFCAENTVRGWLGRMNVRHNYTQLWYLHAVGPVVKSLHDTAVATEKKLRKTMSRMYFPGTIDEWVYEYLDPLTEKIYALSAAVERLSHFRVFPRRIFSMLRDK